MRVIVKIETEDMVYEVGKEPAEGDFTVQSIEFRRDGLRSINGGAPDPEHYLITLVHPINDKDVVYIVVPYDEMKRLMFVHVEKKKSEKEESFETPTDMKQE